jgi:hypothetical protein
MSKAFASQKALIDYAERKGLVYLWEAASAKRQPLLSPAFDKRRRQLSRDQYEMVDVQTPSGVRRAMLFPKAILEAEFVGNRQVLAMNREAWRAKRAAKRRPTSSRNE